ncbi:hypothetical protein DNTS_003898 [Danionella cerebrum]|uniref:Uncharacterized protein n=1 Tax=Danionella cerebrum TaxID=2873325 RepID=A0A553N2G6_9TELE|nr:hypothetical protein DNTS_003898 [Danionella translucida]
MAEKRSIRMSIEVEALLLEAKESIEAAQNYRSELQQRLHGLSQARKQVKPSQRNRYSNSASKLVLTDGLTHGTLRLGSLEDGDPACFTLLSPYYASGIFSNFLLLPPSPPEKPHSSRKQSCNFLLFMQDRKLGEHSVRGSASQTREALQRHFQDLQTALSRLLNERLTSLMQEVDNIETDSISPLEDCQKLIEQGISTADELLREGEAAIRCGLNEKEEKLGSFTKKALQIQLDR